MTELLTLAEVAEHLHLSLRSVQRLVASGQLRIVRVGRRPLVTVKEYEAYIAGLRRAA